MKRERGITLIALVVTIVVLIILASISIATFTESERSYVVNADGQIFDEEEIADEMDKKALKFLVNSGDDGFVVLPISIEEFETGNFEIDWGDGTSGVDEEYISETSKIASLNNLKVSVGTYPDGTSHTYKEKNKEYIVTINGKCTEINSRFGEVSTDKIIELRQWGETGLESVILENCINLTKIANPERDTFNNIDFQNYSPFSFAGNISLKEIPSDLFKYCENIKAFTYTFAGCTSLTEIPEDLFSNCLNVENFGQTFWHCTNLTGNAINSWQRVPNGESNDYIGIPDGSACYGECTNLNDYLNIPEYWRVRSVAQ